MARNKNSEETVNRILDTSMELFLKKGYEKTTIQDIVDALGNLSKGAIYHHFKSKEEIIEAIIPRLYEKGPDEMIESTNIVPKNGLEKIKLLLIASLKNKGQEKLVKAAPNLMKSPKFLTEQLYGTIEKLVPELILPIIKEGIEDGSIKSDKPEELGEITMILMNIWLNPIIFHVSKEKLFRKFEILQVLLEDLGMPILDYEVLEILEKYRMIIENSKK